ncbi:MAG: hypothetical protein Kow00133_21500 [Amphiplicatus sp.]
MTAWWNGLTARERALVAIGGVLAALLSLIQFVIVPIADWRAAAHREAQAAETTYRLVAEAAALGGGARAAPEEAVPIRNAVVQAARDNGVPLTFLNPRPDGDVEAQANEVDPENLYRMLAVLEARYGVEVARADIARLAPDSPIVRARMTFSR